YLNFMGNEFGHPEWIDFPREGNHWSYHYARRQWSLADNPGLKYHFLEKFDQAMIRLCAEKSWLAGPGPRLLHDHGNDQVLAFSRGAEVFVFNFSPTRSFSDYRIPAPSGKYRLILDTDSPDFGGHGRVDPGVEHFTLPGEQGRPGLFLYLPNRAGLVLSRGD
ncbi:MAG: alpha amylase C-terminal domain-containing protein, partial [Pseudomonadota bacterium]